MYCKFMLSEWTLIFIEMQTEKTFDTEIFSLITGDAREL